MWFSILMDVICDANKTSFSHSVLPQSCEVILYILGALVTLGAFVGACFKISSWCFNYFLEKVIALVLDSLKKKHLDVLRSIVNEIDVFKLTPEQKQLLKSEGKKNLNGQLPTFKTDAINIVIPRSHIKTDTLEYYERDWSSIDGKTDQ